MHMQNIFGNVCQTTPSTCSAIGAYFQANMQWIQSQINSNPNDAYWYQVWNSNLHLKYTDTILL